MCTGGEDNSARGVARGRERGVSEQCRRGRGPRKREESEETKMKTKSVNSEWDAVLKEECKFKCSKTQKKENLGNRGDGDQLQQKSWYTCRQ